MVRRDFLTKIAIAGFGMTAFNQLVEGATAVPPSPIPTQKPLSLSDIVHVAWPSVVAQIHSERGNEYQKLIMAGKIILQPLGAFVIDGGGKEYPVEELVVPVAWSQRDEARLTTEAKKIDFVAAMLRNVVNCHDNQLAEEAETYRLLVLSKHYSYDMADTYKVDDMYVVKTYTALARIP